MLELKIKRVIALEFAQFPSYILYTDLPNDFKFYGLHICPILLIFVHAKITPLCVPSPTEP